MRNALAAVLLFVASIAVAQPESFKITEVSPQAGSVGGGDGVSIYVDHFPQNCDPAACSAIVQVLFGGAPARSVTVDHDVILAMTPEHAPATVDVSVVVGSPVTAAKAYRFVDRNETNLLPRSNYERMLVPVALAPRETIAGAFGSLWQSEVWVHNGSAYNVEFFSGMPFCMLANPQGCLGQQFPYLSPGEARAVSVGADAVHAGYVFEVQRGGAAQVSFSARIRDVSRSAENAGTEIPVVRESAFRGGAIQILNVPVESTSRASLRIFAIDGGGPTAKVSVYAMDAPASGAFPVSTLDVPLTAGPSDANQNGFVARAGYAVIPDVKSAFTIPLLLVVPPPPLPDGKYRIEVTGSTDWLKWAMVSVTNNSTQLVTAIGPQ